MLHYKFLKLIQIRIIRIKNLEEEKTHDNTH